jgi:hypothetical protein
VNRLVYIPSENVMGEVISEQLHGAVVRYYLGGFKFEEFMTDEDFEELDYFNYQEGE